MGGAYSTHGRDWKYVERLDENPGWNKPLGRPRLRWEDHFKINID
jgi:hypothetical protein